MIRVWMGMGDLWEKGCKVQGSGFKVQGEMRGEINRGMGVPRLKSSV